MSTNSYVSVAAWKIFGGRLMVCHAILFTLNQRLRTDPDDVLRAFMEEGVDSAQLILLREKLRTGGILTEEEVLGIRNMTGLLCISLEDLLPVHENLEEVEKSLVVLDAAARDEGSTMRDYLNARLQALQDLIIPVAEIIVP